MRPELITVVARARPSGIDIHGAFVKFTLSQVGRGCGMIPTHPMQTDNRYPLQWHRQCVQPSSRTIGNSRYATSNNTRIAAWANTIYNWVVQGLLWPKCRGLCLMALKLSQHFLRTMIWSDGIHATLWSSMMFRWANRFQRASVQEYGHGDLGRVDVLLIHQFHSWINSYELRPIRTLRWGIFLEIQYTTYGTYQMSRD